MSDPNGTRTWQVASFVAAVIVLTYLIWATKVGHLAVPPDRALTIPWWYLALAFGLAEISTFEIRFSTQGLKVSFSETVLLVGLAFGGSPGEVLVAAMAGSAVGNIVIRRLPPLKLIFNTALLSAEVALAWLVLSLINPLLATETLGFWLGALAAGASAAMLAHLSVATVLCIATGCWRLSRFSDPKMLTTVNAATSISLGMVAIAVLQTEPWLIVFLTAPLGLVFTLHQHVVHGHAAEKQVRESKDFLNAIVDNSASVIYVKDMDGRYVLVNKGWESLAGVERSGALGRLPHEVLSPRLADDFTASDQHAYETRRPFLVEESTELADGEHTFVSARFPLLDEDGEMFALGGISTDITATKVLEREAQEQAQLFSSAFRGAHAGMALILTDGRYLEVNEAFCKMLGYSRQELLAKDWMSVTHPDDLVDNLPRSKDLLSGELECHVYEKRFLHKNGRSVTCELSDAVVRNVRGEPIYFVTHIHDVTKQREDEAHFRQAQKMEAVGQLAGGIAHDFNNLLMVMLNYTRFALDGLKPSDQAREDLQQVVDAAERAADLTRQLLAFSRKEPSSPRSVELDAAVLGLSEMLRRSLPENIELRTRCVEQSIKVMIDPTQLEQIILNLAVNARDAMPEGGRLTIVTEVMEIDEEWSKERPGLRPGIYARLRVADSGVGMPSEVLDRVFEPFFTTKERGRGTGLGLAMVYGILKTVGGYIYVNSDEGVGTTVSIYLPLLEGPDVAPAAATPTRTVHHHGSGQIVLVVEDETSVRRLTQRVLLGAGFQVVSASTGAEAVALVAEEGLAPDLVITDVVMPGISGKATADRIRQSLPAVPILYMSGYSDDIISVQTIGHDESILPKPFKSEQLLDQAWALLEVRDAKKVAEEAATSA